MTDPTEGAPEGVPSLLRRRYVHRDLVLTSEDLAAAVARVALHDEFAFDVETVPVERPDGTLNPDDALDPHRNRVIWVSLGAPGLGVSIPLGHPHGSIILPKRKVKVFEPTGQTLKSGEPELKQKTKTMPPLYGPPPQQLTPGEVFGALEPLFFSGRRKIGHNVKFDVKTVAKYYDGRIMPGPYGDTSPAFRLVDDNYPTDRLKPIVKKVFGFTYEQFGKRIEEASLEQGSTYARHDAYYTWLLWDWLYKLIERLDLVNCLDLDMDCLPGLARAEYRGTAIDVEQLETLAVRLDVEVDDVLAQLYVDAGRKEWNPNADAEVAWFVYEHCGNPVTVRTKKTQAPSTAKATLEKIAEKDERVARVFEYRELDKMRGTYVNAIRSRLNNGAVGTNFKIAGAATGRLSASQPNLQNIPRPDEDPRGLGTLIRGMFIARPGHRLIVCDYGQIEYRVLAHLSGDPTYRQMFMTGEDPHVLTAVELFNKGGIEDVSKTERTVAKNTGFAIVYGAGHDKVAQMSGVSIEQAKDVAAKHAITFPRVWEWIAEEKARASARRHPYYATMLGRRRRLPDIRFGEDWMVWRAERQGINHIVQGSAAEVMKMALVNLDHLLEDEMHLLLTVHDEVVVEAPEELADRAAEIVQEAMAGPAMQTLDVPLVADPVVVDRWSAAK